MKDISKGTTKYFKYPNELLKETQSVFNVGAPYIDGIDVYSYYVSGQ